MTYPQRLFDYLTRSDELLLENIKVMREISAALSALGSQQKPGGLIAMPTIMMNTGVPANTIDLRDKLANGQMINYRVLAYPLDTAETEKEVAEPGESMVAATDGSLDACFVRFHNVKNDRSPLGLFDWTQPFWKFYLTWPAQAGKTLYLAIGKNASATGSSRSIGSNPTTPPSEVIYNAMPAASPEYSSLADMRGSKRLLVHATSTLDEPCNLQVIGNIANSLVGATEINGLLPLGAGDVDTAYLSAGLAFDDWHPFIGVMVVCPALPAAGALTIRVLKQD